ncbi:hypothetical protein [Kutzneria sp. NPDC052558]|uniref:immunity protein Imm33 domain-containing protein n=1 Tax=Kutzneria sp. NPDC052558 TaxID=3364121 RepID=UPI0037C546B0
MFKKKSPNGSQAALCARMGVVPAFVTRGGKLGVSRATLTGGWPLNGVRVREEGGASGWYIWSGQVLSEDPSFFIPLHVGHLIDARPEVEEYLGLPSGWRFLIAPDHEDVWFDENALDPS